MEEENKEVEEQETKEVEKEKTTFTQSEVDSQISKAVDTALKNREAKHQDEMKQAIDEAIAEKERLSKLSEKEKKEEQLTQREKDIAKRLANIERKELKHDAITDLTNKGLPIQFADFLLADNAENTLSNINEFKNAFDEAIEVAVKDRLKGEAPKKAAKTTKGITRDDINKMNYKERLKFKQENTDQYNSLMGK